MVLNLKRSIEIDLHYFLGFEKLTVVSFINGLGKITKWFIFSLLILVGDFKSISMQLSSPIQPYSSS